MHSDHFQPGSNVIRAAVASPTCTTSTRVFSGVRVSSAESKSNVWTPVMTATPSLWDLRDPFSSGSGCARKVSEQHGPSARERRTPRTDPVGGALERERLVVARRAVKANEDQAAAEQPVGGRVKARHAALLVLLVVGLAVDPPPADPLTPRAVAAGDE